MNIQQVATMLNICWSTNVEPCIMRFISNGVVNNKDNHLHHHHHRFNFINILSTADVGNWTICEKEKKKTIQMEHKLINNSNW